MITVADADLMNLKEWVILNKWVESLEGDEGDKNLIEKAKSVVVDMDRCV